MRSGIDISVFIVLDNEKGKSHDKCMVCYSWVKQYERHLDWLALLVWWKCFSSSALKTPDELKYDVYCLVALVISLWHACFCMHYSGTSERYLGKWREESKLFIIIASVCSIIQFHLLLLFHTDTNDRYRGFKDWDVVQKKDLTSTSKPYIHFTV